MGLFKRKAPLKYDRPRDESVSQVFKKGDTMTKLSFLVFGIGNIVNKQVVRGLIFLALEILYFVYMIIFGISSIGDFITLGTAEQAQVYNEALGIYEYSVGDNSMLCLLYGVITIVLTVGIIFTACMSAKSAYCTQVRKAKGQNIPTFMDDIRSLKEENLHAFLLTFPIIGILVFTIVPLVFMILIAFTSYDHEHQPPGTLFSWVGLANFKSLIASSSSLATTFWPVLGWTLIWAVSATVTCYILGLLLALLINRKGTKGKGFWRFMFVLSVAVPQFVTLLTMRTIFNANGPVNVLLREFGVIGATDSIPFFTDPLLAKITIICINIWIGVPFTMLSTTGILQNIPADLYEAAKIDGASAPVIFRKITLPYMLFVMTPNLITSFTGNINNFNVIFLLSGGGPDSLEYYYAGKTDLLVTWLYKLTITQKDYNLGAVIGILVFIILATLSLLTYHRTGAYKDEGAFQ
ncbi:MAG: sugar ABC transporter permease [Lachnospiraceae bacterium]|jgi:arabinogalactan oligomer/maltooligosaccharide transport system permease protein|nr:sugar ABC transporter permease [Lachnospiraceae bacterium]